MLRSAAAGGVIERLTRIAQRPVSRETFEKSDSYVALLREESSRQNLISRTTLDNVWDRHILEFGAASGLRTSARSILD